MPREGLEEGLDMVTKLLKIEPGKTSRDKAVQPRVVACMGACGLAPVVNVTASSTPR